MTYLLTRCFEHWYAFDKVVHIAKKQNETSNDVQIKMLQTIGKRTLTSMPNILIDKTPHHL